MNNDKMDPQMSQISCFFVGVPQSIMLLATPHSINHLKKSSWETFKKSLKIEEKLKHLTILWEIFFLQLIELRTKFFRAVLSEALMGRISSFWCCCIIPILLEIIIRIKRSDSDPSIKRVILTECIKKGPSKTIRSK